MLFPASHRHRVCSFTRTLDIQLMSAQHRARCWWLASYRRLLHLHHHVVCLFHGNQTESEIIYFNDVVLKPNWLNQSQFLLTSLQSCQDASSFHWHQHQSKESVLYRTQQYSVRGSLSLEEPRLLFCLHLCTFTHMEHVSVNMHIIEASAGLKSVLD